ncbi:MAG TPA: hypothetical protein DCP92_21705 [Nitrospiraceae bacterium]|jgi:hypothetical protein|nr:hypothetical protein [Nitrospiraceae bacterium]
MQKSEDESKCTITKMEGNDIHKDGQGRLALQTCGYISGVNGASTMIIFNHFLEHSLQEAAT